MGRVADQVWGDPAYDEALQDEAVEEDENGWNPDEDGDDTDEQ